VPHSGLGTAKRALPCGRAACGATCASALHALPFPGLQVNVGPFFLVPVGGLYRMQMTTARIVEPPSPTSTKPGYPVTRHLILFDEDLRNVSGGGSAEEGKGCKRVLWGSPEAEAHARVVLGAGSPRRR
jgi:hypothetical protein